MNTKICTTIEQSKKLIELGVDINTADIVYNVLDESYIRHDTPIDKYHTPAWSLSVLVDLMPKNVEIERTHIGWRCDYYSNRDSLLKYGKDKNTLFDAAFEMVCWLKENGKI